MQVFEFHFNPKIREDLIFDSFCYEPENIYEKRVGSLYMAGMLKNILPQNSQFLNNLAKVIKEKYYCPVFRVPENSLKESLRTANESLERIAKSGNVSWLGNLNFATLSLRNFELNFTKVGNLKILLLREGEVIDIDQKLKFQEIEPYPLKIFGNIVSGKLAENDIILVLTKEVFDYFQNQAILDRIAKLTPFNEKQLKEILNNKKEEFTGISGICLLIFLNKEALYQKKEAILFQPKTKLKEFSLKPIRIAAGHTFIFAINYVKKIIRKPNLPSFHNVKAKVPKLSKIRLPQIATPKLKNKNLILILVLILFLILGSFIFQKEKERQLKEYQAVLNEIQEKEKFYKMERIEEPLLSPDFDKNELISKKISVLKENAPENFKSDIFCDYNSNLYSLDNTAGEIIKYSPKWTEPKVWIKSDLLIEAKSIIIDGSIWILNKDNSITEYYAGKFQKTLKLDIFPESKNFSRIFTSETLPYLYILEPIENRLIIIDKIGQIIKQYQSEKFDDLLDFAVSENGKAVYLLNGLEVYQIRIEL